MAQRPGDRPTPRGEVRRLDDEQAALRRDEVDMPREQPLVKIREQRSESWVNGVIWLKMPGQV